MELGKTAPRAELLPTPDSALPPADQISTETAAADRERFLQEIQDGLDSGRLPVRLFAGAESETDLIISYARYLVAEKLIPDDLNLYKSRISNFSYRTFTTTLEQRFGESKHISSSRIQQVAEELGVLGHLGYKLDKTGKRFTPDRTRRVEASINLDRKWLLELHKVNQELDREKREDAIASGADFLIANHGNAQINEESILFMIKRKLLPGIESLSMFNVLFPSQAYYEEAVITALKDMLAAEVANKLKLSRRLEQDLATGSVPTELFHNISDQRQVLKFLKSSFEQKRSGWNPEDTSKIAAMRVNELPDDEKLVRYAKFVVARDMLKQTELATLVRICSVRMTSSFAGEIVKKSGTKHKTHDDDSFAYHHEYKATDVERRAQDLGVFEFIFNYREDHLKRYRLPGYSEPAAPPQGAENDLEAAA